MKTFSFSIYPQCIIPLPQVTNATKITYCGWKDFQTRKLGKIENGDIGSNIFISFCPHLHHSDSHPPAQALTCGSLVTGGASHI